jgi:methionyl-tRNA synthetase
VARRYDASMEDLALSQALGAVWELVGEANRYLVDREPWALAGDEARREELGEVLYAAAETLRVLAVMIQPIMPSAAGRLWRQLGVPKPLLEQRLPDAAAWGGLEPGTQTHKGEALFPRLSS